MGKRAELALEKRSMGMNCAQAIATAFADYTGLDEESLAIMTRNLGTGVGGTLEGTCGAVSAAALVLGLASGQGNANGTMRDAGKLVRDFKGKNGAVVCRELKGIDTGKMLRSCPGCIEDAADILESILEG